MSQKVAQIIKGEKAEFTIKLLDSNDDPYDLTSFDEFKVCLLKDDKSILEITDVASGDSVVAVDGSSVKGKLLVTIDAADTALLKADDDADVDGLINNATTPNPKGFHIPKGLQVIETLCSP